MAVSDPKITKKRVEMRSISLTPDGTMETKGVDYVVEGPELDAYVADAQSKWQLVTVSDEYDAGPGGYEGQTVVPAHLPLPNAGETRAATQEV